MYLIPQAPATQAGLRTPSTVTLTQQLQSTRLYPRRAPHERHAGEQIGIARWLSCRVRARDTLDTLFSGDA
jgi:hypothetical protein